MISRAIKSIKNRMPERLKARLKAIAPPKDDSRLIILLNNLGLKSHYYAYPPKLRHKLLNKAPSIVSVKIPQIESLTQSNILLNEDVVKHYQKNKTKILYDLSTEAITFTEYPSEVLIKFHLILKNAGLDPSDIILLCSNSVAEDHYKQWAIDNDFSQYQINMLGYDFYFFEYFWEVSHCDWLTKNKKQLVEQGYKTAFNGKKRSKHFLCLNLRPRWHRTATLLHLLKDNLLERGYVTYHGEAFADHDSVSTEDQTRSHISKLPNGNELLSYCNALKEITPLTFDRNADNLRKDLWHRKPGEVEFLFPDIKASPTGEIDSYFEIITETWFTDESASYITEKTIRPLLRLQPFIHIGTPFLLQKLKDKGFKTFAPYIDERYDTITDPYERLQVIFKEISRLCRMNIDEIHQLYTDLWPILIHNYHHYLSNTLKLAQKEVKSDLFNKIQTLK